MTPRA